MEGLLELLVVDFVAQREVTVHFVPQDHDASISLPLLQGDVPFLRSFQSG